MASGAGTHRRFCRWDPASSFQEFLFNEQVSTAHNRRQNHKVSERAAKPLPESRCAGGNRIHSWNRLSGRRVNDWWRNNGLSCVAHNFKSPNRREKKPKRGEAHALHAYIVNGLVIRCCLGSRKRHRPAHAIDFVLEIHSAGARSIAPHIVATDTRSNAPRSIAVFWEIHRLKKKYQIARAAPPIKSQFGCGIAMPIAGPAPFAAASEEVSSDPGSPALAGAWL